MLRLANWHSSFWSRLPSRTRAPTLRLFSHRSRVHTPLSFSQEQIWFLTQFEPESTFYNMPFIVHINGKLSLPALEWSINKIVERHETLRMVFDVEDGFPIQRVQPPSWIPLQVKDLTSLSRPQEEIYRFSHEETARLFDLSRGPLLRAM